MYKIALHPRADKEIEKLDKKLRQIMRDRYFAEIAESPYTVGKRLMGNLKDFYSYRFSYQGVNYRIIYEILKEKLVVILMVSTRENLYKRLLQRFRL
ncbi:MAG: type II toxin-antitoxin system RelE/ParE family toxin [Candidatus Stahlbacteria bacterium]|nr:type II toxin-antitoxin system RelE/ParE family toxin [Candidatus Stahlbacteria bacterium]